MRGKRASFVEQEIRLPRTPTKRGERDEARISPSANSYATARRRDYPA